MEHDGMISPTEVPDSPTSPADAPPTIFPQSEWPPTIFPEGQDVPTIAPAELEHETTGTEGGGPPLAPNQSDVTVESGGEGVQPLAPDETSMENESKIPTPAREEPSCNEVPASSMALPGSTLSNSGGAASGSAGPEPKDYGEDGSHTDGEDDLHTVDGLLDGELSAAMMQERRDRVKRRLEWSTEHAERSRPRTPRDHMFVPRPGNKAEERLRKLLDKKNAKETKRKAKKRAEGQHWLAMMWEKKTVAVSQLAGKQRLQLATS